jgi:hypothetical protein
MLKMSRRAKPAAMNPLRFVTNAAARTINTIPIGRNRAGRILCRYIIGM